MKPYYIHSSFFKAWVDLESIQVIADVYVLPEAWWGTDIPSATFSIQFAFQDTPLQVNTFRRAVLEHGKEKTEAEKAVIHAEIAELQRMHDELVEAWKSIS